MSPLTTSSVALEATKADQKATNEPVPVAAAPAVRALWRWMHTRRDVLGMDGSTRPAVFCLPDQSPLTSTALTRSISSWLGELGVTDAVVKGRTFRRGGASALMASGAARSDVALVGRWRTQRMTEVYSNDMAKRARRLEMSRRMAPQ